MTTITIRELTAPDAVVSFDNGEEYTIKITNPVSPKGEAELEWYFEEHLRFPFTEQVRAQRAAGSITAYGEALFNQVFADRDAHALYKSVVQSGIENLAFEIAGSPEFHSIHWEALKDPHLPQPLAVQAAMVRRNLTPQTVRAELRPFPTINLLIVTARPGGANDVAYRTISRPLVEALRRAAVRVQIDILRPGTYRALVNHLMAIRDSQGTGFYHVVHFDVHGSLLSYADLEQNVPGDRFRYEARYGRGPILPYDGLKAFLFLEGAAAGQADPVEAQELAGLLIGHHVPIVILNACQSAKQVRPQGDGRETGETSLGSRLMTAGVQTVLAMAYSITVTGAEVLMTTLYEKLFAGRGPSAAIRLGRLELHNNKARDVYFNQKINLEDWLLPVVYKNREMQLRTREFTPEESKAYYGRQSRRYKPPRVTYGFVGRDLDILQIERHLLTKGNVLLIRGMGGSGKTTLLHHLGEWWETTGFVDRVRYFGYDERAWTRQQIMAEVARDLMTEVEYLATFQPSSPGAQQAMLAERLRAHRHLLILDNLESITGAHLAILNTLPRDEQKYLHDFLRELTKGSTLVLLGSRGGEDWLASGTFEHNVYDLPGLDPEAATTLADRILERHAATSYRKDKGLQRLIDLLGGYPLPMEVVLSNLAHQTPAQILEALQTGDEAIDMRSEKKTESILRCIDYSHSNLSPEAQQLLTCLAPFTAVIDSALLPQYSDQLREQPALAHLPFHRWEEVLTEATNWGLMSPHPELSGVLNLQPIFPYFLRSRLGHAEQSETRLAIHTAFRIFYEGLGGSILALIDSKEPREKQLGQALARLEYENFFTALNLALEAQISVEIPYRVLSDVTRDHRQGLELGMTVLTRLEGYPSEALSGELGHDYVGVLDYVALRQLELKDYEAAEASYNKALSVLFSIEGFDADGIRRRSASIYHQLGAVAQEQRQWEQAEDYYQQALQIKIAFNDRHSQANTYHELGIVAQEHRQWEQAEKHYRQALEIKIAFNDRHSQASTYHQLGTVAQEQRQWEQAERYYQQALEIFIAFGNSPPQARTYRQLGTVAQEHGQWEQARKYYQQALEIDVAFSDRHSQALTYYQLGIVAQEQRQWEQARKYYQQALEIFIEFSDRYSQGPPYHQLGVVAQQQRQWEQAQNYYQKALEMFIAFNDRHSQAGTYYHLGTVAAERGEWKRATEHMLQALAISHSTRDQYSLTIVLGSLARVWQACGDATIPAAVARITDTSPEEIEKRFRSLTSTGDEQGEGST